MARTVNEQEFARKRNEIVEAGMRLVFAKGYERMTIQDVLTELNISSGAFYHYFGSKPALLDAFIERIGEVSEEALRSIIDNPDLPALEKLRGFLRTFERLRETNRPAVVELGLVWYTDENAIVRQKVEEAVRRQRAPLIAQIVRQGVAEGVFSTPYPEYSGEVVLSLLQGMGNTHVRLLLSVRKEGNVSAIVDEIVAAYAAYTSAIERVLGAPEDSLRRTDVGEVEGWITSVRGDA